ncbi:MAG: DnaD domain protein [Clostridia bacterium]|nr:DnaD domain protein [Clostridia bacterium]
MATYHWNPAAMGDVFVLPAAVVDTALGLANPEQIKVLLWFSRHHQQWDAAACAAAVGGTPAACESHLQFWVQQGVLQSAGEVTAETPVKAPISRPPAVKPRIDEVLQYQKSHPDFGPFLDAAAAHLGKALSHGDVATLLYLLTTAGLPENVILLEIAYAVSLGKANMRYVEKLALAWADEDLVTYEQVDSHIRGLQRQQENAARVEMALALPRPLTAAQAKLADKWVSDWGFSDEMLQHAQTRTVEKCEKTNLNYMDKILEGWYGDGIRKPEQIPQPYLKKSGVAATNPETSSLDMDGFEQQLRQYRPKYKKNEK